MLHCSHLCSPMFIARLLVTTMKLPTLCSLLETRVILRRENVCASFHTRPWLTITYNRYVDYIYLKGISTRKLAPNVTNPFLYASL